jgi:D-alanyl-D-alanine carboxypeptidase
LTALLALASVSPADARGHHRRHPHSRHHSHAAAAQTYSPPYSDIIVDVNSGRVMHATDPDALRHPASLTKIMTLYLLFEQLESGRMRLDTPLQVSAHAASMEPSKLGVRPGTTIDVENAIKAVVTRSANDVAVVIAENIGGTESAFCRLMTQKARALGMSRTTYVDASGLPDDRQITTARDQATLGRAIQDRFPRYYRYFATRSFIWHGVRIGSHNHLMEHMDGVDGIKTGFVRASGFNLVTNLRRDGRHLVGVVMGGRSARSRDAQMQALLNDNVQMASVRRTAPVIAEARQPAARPQQVATAGQEANVIASVQLPAPSPARALRASSPLKQRVADANAAVGSNDPLKPVVVHTVPVRQGAVRRAAIGRASDETRGQTVAMAPLDLAPAQGRGVQVASAGPASIPAIRQPTPGNGILGVLPARGFARGSSVEQTASLPANSNNSVSAARKRSGYIIQVGAFDTQGDAEKRLADARSHAKKVLGSADPFTEKFAKGGKAMYRARFAGLEKNEAEAACKSLKHNEIGCFWLKN